MSQHAADTQVGDGADPLTEVTLRPRTFFAALAVLALLLGLVLSMVPVKVAGPDSRHVSVTCGNALGGVETARLLRDLGSPETSTMVGYVIACEDRLDTRQQWSVVLFFGGLLGGLWLGVVRRRT